MVNALLEAVNRCSPRIDVCLLECPFVMSKLDRSTLVIAEEHRMRSPSLSRERPSYRDLAPEIVRQRLIIEGYPQASISDEAIRDYLKKLAAKIKMIALIEPVTHRSDLYGWAGWVHWETSGAHVYAWEQPRLFFSVDIYTCKTFDEGTAIEFTAKHFSSTGLTYKSV